MAKNSNTVLGGPGAEDTKFIRPGTPPPAVPDEHANPILNFSKEELESFKKMYTEIRAKWGVLAREIANLSDNNFNSPQDSSLIRNALMKFAAHMSNVLKEIEGLGKSDAVRASLLHAHYDSLATASVEDYKTIVDNLHWMVELFDKYKPNFEKLAKMAEGDDRPVLHLKDVQEADTLLDKLSDLIEKNKNSMSKDIGQGTDPDKTEIISSHEKASKMSKASATNRLARLLVDAANRLDLRPPTQITKDQLIELLSYMKALRECYQSMHWVSRGEPYYGDHTLFGNMYNILVSEVDALAEKAVGYTDDAFVVEVQYQTSRMAAHVTEIMSFLPDMTNIQCMLNAEKKVSKEIIPKMLNGLEQAGELSDGLENFLQGIADSHEKIIYHLQRRLKTQKDLKAPVEPNISPTPEPVENVDNEFDTMLQEEEAIQ